MGCSEALKRKAVGFVFLGLVILTWVAQSEVAQFIQVGDYNKPFFLTWFNHGCLVVMVPLSYLGFVLFVRNKPVLAAKGSARAISDADSTTSIGSFDVHTTTTVDKFDSKFLGVKSWPCFLSQLFAVALVGVPHCSLLYPLPARSVL